MKKILSQILIKVYHWVNCGDKDIDNSTAKELSQDNDSAEYQNKKIVINRLIDENVGYSLSVIENYVPDDELYKHTILFYIVLLQMVIKKIDAKDTVETSEAAMRQLMQMETVKDQTIH